MNRNTTKKGQGGGQYTMCLGKRLGNDSPVRGRYYEIR